MAHAHQQRRPLQKSSSSSAKANKRSVVGGREGTSTGSSSSRPESGPYHDLGKFYLHSPDDKSIETILEHINNESLDRFRVCVVTMVSKTPLDETVKSQLVQSLLTNNDAIRNRLSQSNKKSNATSDGPNDEPSDDQPKSELSKALSSILDETASGCDADNQVIGYVNYDLGLIVLNMSSIFDANKLHKLSHEVLAHNRLKNLPANNCDTSNQVPLCLAKPASAAFLDAWPTWNQNTLKTLLLLFSISHIVMFYNPNPYLDYSLISMFRILQTLRLKSQSRITNLLETLASGQVFSQRWMRQARVTCPRVLFVCDSNRLDVQLNGTSLLNLKQSLEDQIYLLLKKTDIISKQIANQEVQEPLFMLPERDFVFVLTRPQDGEAATKAPLEDRAASGDDAYERFLDSDFSYGGKNRAQLQPTDLVKLDEEPKSQQPEAMNSVLIQSKQFSKFMRKHIANIQESGKLGVDAKFSRKRSGEESILLPRLDDFFTVISRLKYLLFPQSSTELARNQLSAPDERRFVDIYNLTNCDELFSKQHCYKMRLMALESYRRALEQKTQAPKLSDDDELHREALEAAKSVYLNHARGQACSLNLELLIESCKKIRLEYRNSRDQQSQQPDVGRDKKAGSMRGTKKQVTRSTSLMSTMSNSRHPERSSLVASKENSASTSHVKRSTSQRSSLTFSRRSNGVRIVSQCDCCGNETRIMVTPTDRAKKLERVEINKLNS